MDTNYERNMQETYNTLVKGVQGENIGSPVVPAYDTLTKNGIKLYVDNNGKLRAVNTNPGISDAVIEYLGNRNLVKPVQPAKTETFSTVTDFVKGM